MRAGSVVFGPESGGALERLRSRVPKDELEYVQALATVALLGLALLLFGYLLAKSPRRALGFVLGRTGLK